MPGPLRAGEIRVTRWAGKAPAVRVGGDTVTFPTEVRVPIVDGTPETPLDVEPTGADWDIIVSEGAVTVRPDAWIAALKVGGRLVVVERSGPNGKAVLYVRGREGVSRRELFDSHPPVLAEMTPAPVFAL